MHTHTPHTHAHAHTHKYLHTRMHTQTNMRKHMCTPAHTCTRMTQSARTFTRRTYTETVFSPSLSLKCAHPNTVAYTYTHTPKTASRPFLHTHKAPSSACQQATLNTFPNNNRDIFQRCDCEAAVPLARPCYRLAASLLRKKVSTAVGRAPNTPANRASCAFPALFSLYWQYLLHTLSLSLSLSRCLSLSHTLVHA